jgi:hypothetical protein
MALRRGRTGLQFDEVGAELRQAAGIAQRLLAAAVDGFGKGIGISGTGLHGNTAQV